ncbi:MAG: translocation/assembly module TamB domain-containing protein [Pseudomonadota bacterium]
MRTWWHIALLSWLLVWAGVARAKEDDKGWLTRQIQDALSGAGRAVEIEGFEGALSSNARFSRLTIADDDGIWLTLDGAELIWNRSALLRGRLEVEELTATRLDLPRLPSGGEAEEPDVTAEAEPFEFNLPDLPVSIEIGALGIDEINLGAPLLGQPTQLSLSATARYTETEAFADFEARRTDGRAGRFDIEANLARASNALTLTLALTEEAQGIAATLLNLPGAPPVEMAVNGAGPLDDFRTTLNIATDGTERLSGEITLAAQSPRRASDTPDRRLQADIGGDITALLAPEYRDFFGEDVQLRLDALREGSGAIEVSDFTLRAQAAALRGQVTLNAENWPTFVDVTGSIANAQGTPVLLPGGGADTTVERVDLNVAYDAGDDDAFDAAFDVSAFRTAGVEVARARLRFDGTLQGNLGSVGQFLADMTLEAQGIALDDDALQQAVGPVLQGRAEVNFIEGQPLRIEDMDFDGSDYGLTGRVAVNGPGEGLLTRLSIVLDAGDLSRFSALAGQSLAGQAALALRGTVTPLSGAFELDISGSTQDLALGIAQADTLLAGRTVLGVAARRDETGTFLRDLSLQNPALELTGEAALRTDASTVNATFTLADVGLVVSELQGPVNVTASANQDSAGWRVDARTQGPYRAALTARGLATGPQAALDFTADLPDVAPFAAIAGQDISGPLSARGRLSRAGEGWEIDTTARGPFDASAEVAGAIAPRIDVTFAADVPEISRLVPQVNGPLSAQGRLRQEDVGFFIDARASGPFGARVSAEGLATGPDMSLTFTADVPNVSALAPGVPGALNASGTVMQRPQGIELMANATGPYASRARVSGIVTGPEAAVDFNLALANIGALVDRVNGPLDVTGSARRAGTAWQIDTQAQGPSGTQARIAGQVAGDGTLALDVTGSAPLGLSRPFIAPRNLQGTARFDLAVNGPPALSSLSGRIETSGATLTAPNLRITLEGIAAQIGVGGNRATLDVRARASEGGELAVGGAVTLTPTLPADISVALRGLVLSDPRLYRTAVNGDLRIAGPLTGAASIAGTINVGETNVNVPATGLTSIGDIPPITHVGSSRAAAATRARAGLARAGAARDPAASGASGPGLGLDVAVNAPNRIFVRGRGLDAELGGSLRLTGDTNNIISVGRFDLLRGRLDILGKRFDLREGAILFQGTLVPFLRFVSATSTSAGEARVIVEGPADDPDVRFEATPEAPQDEVLAQLLFGRNLSQISAFQALQLAGAVATLAGRGGNGIIGNLRDGFGLDDLDVTTTDTGATELRVGKYISDNVYTDVTASSDGEAEVSINLDITESLTARGALKSDGNTSIGIFFERDY